MRFALRRMRTAFALLRRELGLPALQAFNDDARWLTKLLGAARDWDVFTCETLSEIAQYLPPDIANFEALREAAVPPRAIAYTALRESLASKRYNRCRCVIGLTPEGGVASWKQGRCQFC